MIFRNEDDVKKFFNGFLKLIDTADFDMYCDYDMEGEECIVEIKVRKADYDECMIEVDKYDRIMADAKEMNKSCYYVVGCKEKLDYFDLTRMPSDQLIKREVLCPKTTDFANNEKVKKEVYLLPSKYKWNIK